MNMREIEELLRDPKNKIMAIKLYRELKEADLKEAKQAIENFLQTGSWEYTDESTFFSEQSLQEIEELAKNPQKKVVAIKKYRDLTGKGLKEAKQAIEHFQRSGSWKVESNTTLEGDLDEVKQLLTDGMLVSAIKVYHELSGKSLKESKEAIEAMDEYKEFKASEDVDVELVYGDDGQVAALKSNIKHSYDNDSDLARLNERSVSHRPLTSDDVFSKGFLILGIIFSFILSVFGFLFYAGKF